MIDVITSEVFRPNKLTNRFPFWWGPVLQKKVVYGVYVSWGRGGEGQRKHHKAFIANDKYIFFDRSRSFPQQMITSKYYTINSMEDLTQVHSLLKDIFSKRAVPYHGKKKNVCSSLQNANCLALSRKVQNLPIKRTQTNVSPKSSIFGKGQKEDDRHGNEKDIWEENYFPKFSSERRVSQSNIFIGKKGWANLLIINLRNFKEFYTLDHLKRDY